MSYRPNVPLPLATTSQAGLFKPDGATITTAADSTASVVGVTVTSLTDISSGALGGPALSDVDTVNRSGTDYKVTLSARSALFRKTPAGSRTIALSVGSAVATLTAGDNDKQVVVTGAPGTLSSDGTITDGFRCLVVNKTSGALSYSGINGLSGTTALASGGSCQVYMAASATEATAAAGAATLAPATTTILGGVKPDGTTLTAATDGTLSVVTVSTHALSPGPSLSTADEFATFSISAAADVKYTCGQVAAFTQSNVQSWTTAARPSFANSQYGSGYNTTLGRFEFWNGLTWVQHCRLTDIVAGAGQLLGGSGSNGIATAIAIGTGLSLTGNTLSSTGGSTATVPVTTVMSSGPSQALAFPSTGSKAFDITLTANCTFTLSGGASGQLQTITLVIRGGAGGFSATIPSGVKWPGGVAPTMDTSAGSYNEVYIRTIDGGVTYSGTY